MAKRRRHLHHKLARSVFWGTTLLAAIISVVFWVSELKRSSDKTALLLNQLLDTVESTAAIAAYSGNRQIGEDVLKGLLRNDIVHAVQITNGQGLELGLSRSTDLPRPEPVVRVLRSPFGDGEEVGRLTVVPEALFTLQEARHSALVGALNSVVLIAVTALMVVGLVRTLLTVPLVRVSARLHEISAGEAERLDALPRHRDDELGQLVEDINRLLATLEEKLSAEHQLREDVQAMERKLRGIFETTSAGIFQLDGNGVLLTANPSLARVLRWPEGIPVELSGAGFLAKAFEDPARVNDLMRQAEHLNQPVSADLLLNHDDQGEGVWVHCLLSRQEDEDGYARFEGVVYDITERRKAERRMRHEADHDALTGLLRRHVAERMLDRLLNLASVGGGKTHAVLLLDLDGFKEINDRHGHASGDQVLIEVSKRLRDCVRVGDITSRLGGDEFLLVLVNCVPVEQARAIAHDIVSAVRRPILLGSGCYVTLGVSIGIAVGGLEGNQSELLIRAADRAMYAVKHQGKNGYGFYRPDGGIDVRTVGEEA